VIQNRDNSREYKFGKNCRGWYLLESKGFNIKLEEISFGSSTSMHYHKGMTQFFFVNKGTLSIETENKLYTLRAGEGIELAGNLKHRVHNANENVVEYIVSEKYTEDCDTYYD